ncbi:hypothetical protein CLG96_07095 [Sphingomonas oleivorans]|uniref:Uncharacterized protein n=2 Tax=Sphingomonas oleivorans TaxID=1735121 RepID=A0A2T5G0G5_9SPHN|nr:hypothetical protein CLG96_07095 [Sphingomonas oleivorans]
MAERVDYAQLTIRQRVVVRVPAAPMTIIPPRMQWKDKKGPRCVAMGDIAGAAVIAPRSVDLILRGGTRLRAQFARSCPALDYYSGFYVLPTADGQLCADRDAVRARSGGECEIERFRMLMPAK